MVTIEELKRERELLKSKESLKRDMEKYNKEKKVLSRQVFFMKYPLAKKALSIGKTTAIGAGNMFSEIGVSISKEIKNRKRKTLF